jgi:hypothetical protein
MFVRKRVFHFDAPHGNIIVEEAIVWSLDNSFQLEFAEFSTAFRPDQDCWWGIRVQSRTALRETYSSSDLSGPM